MTDDQISFIFVMFSILMVINAIMIVLFLAGIQKINSGLYVSKLESYKKHKELEKLIKIYFVEILKELKK